MLKTAGMFSVEPEKPKPLPKTLDGGMINYYVLNLNHLQVYLLRSHLFAARAYVKNAAVLRIMNYVIEALREQDEAHQQRKPMPDGYPVASRAVWSDLQFAYRILSPYKDGKMPLKYLKDSLPAVLETLKDRLYPHLKKRKKAA